MDGAAGEEGDAALRVTFDPRLKLEFHGSRVASDAGLLPFRDLDDALGLTDLAGEVLTDTRTGQNSRHTLIAQLRQSVFGRLAGYEDVNDADRLAHDPALRWVVGGRAVTQTAASTSQMGRFETEVLTQAANLSALADLSGCWIDRVHARRPVKAGQSQMSSSSAGSFSPGSIASVSEAETCSGQTGREKRILLSSPYAIALPVKGIVLDMDSSVS